MAVVGQAMDQSLLAKNKHNSPALVLLHTVRLVFADWACSGPIRISAAAPGIEFEIVVIQLAAMALKSSQLSQLG